jgi:hypothetical protein
MIAEPGKKSKHMESWGPWKAWWLDTLKFVLTFSIGAVLTVTVLHEIEEARSVRSFQWRKHWERDLQVLDEFREASLLYVQATKGALAEVSRGSGGELVGEWKGPAHSKFLLSLEAVEFRFAERKPLIPELRRVIDETRKNLYEEYLRLSQQDDKPGVYEWSETLHEMIRLRRQMAEELERIIESPP